jgi:hypothetical protein
VDGRTVVRKVQETIVGIVEGRSGPGIINWRRQWLIDG